MPPEDLSFQRWEDMMNTSIIVISHLGISRTIRLTINEPNIAHYASNGRKAARAKLGCKP